MSRIWQHNIRKGTPEGHLQLQILKYLKFKGYYCAKLKNKGSYYKGRYIKDRYQCLGLPDLICFTPKLYFIECKVKGNIQTPHQQTFELLCNKANVPYIVAYDLETIIKLFP